MKYIDLINNVWELREQGIISSLEQDLYLYLIHKCNRLNWKNPFNQSTDILCSVLGINRNTLTQRRNRLKQLGLIDFKDGITKKKPAEYRLMCIKNDTQPITESSTQCSTQPMTEPSTYTKDKTRQDNKKESKEKTKRFSPPQIEEIKAYCNERKNNISAEHFFNFYTSKDWMIGKNKMKDWRAAVRTWESKQKGGINETKQADRQPNYAEPM
ncbi:MAG: hypothetical protein KIC84_11515 [Dysgonomonas mossii]|uniref:hypothetical protein n=1 Tax=Dysgonomonas mossii TaxID=163665 RepID=UPI0026EC355E|nr:hypothetical protein [Dysgonomonas mossii]MBS5907842.1 hypothetical protein [Dysgonomonas mossii]